MGRPKKVQEKQEYPTFYHAGRELLEIDNELYANESVDEAITYLKDSEPNVKEIYLYEIKLVGKYKVKFDLQEVAL